MTIHLEPGDTLQFNYSTAPTLTKIPSSPRPALPASVELSSRWMEIPTPICVGAL